MDLTDFSDGIEKLEPNGANWGAFQCRFLVAVRHHNLFGHFDGSSKMPTAVQALLTPVKAGSAENTTTTTTTTTRGTAGADINAAITAWKKTEKLALYLLMQKLPDSILIKYMRKKTVAEMWTAIVKEFTHKVMMMEPHLRSEFMAMRYEKGANPRSEFDRVRMKYVALWNAGVEISNSDYRSLIIQFVPPDIANFISLLYATFKIYSRTVLKSGTAKSSAESPGSSNELGKEPFTLDPEIVMEIATEEWERRGAYRKSRKPSSNTNPATVSSENPGSNAGGGHSRGRGRRRGRGRGGRQGDCGNCGGRGHRQDNCPSPKVEEEDKRPSTQLSGTKPNTEPAQSNPSSLTGSQVIANRAIFEGFSGAWTAVAADIDDILDSVAEIDGDDHFSARRP